MTENNVRKNLDKTQADLRLFIGHLALVRAGILSPDALRSRLEQLGLHGGEAKEQEIEIQRLEPAPK